MSRIFFVHGWGGSPSSDWLPWARKEFTKRGYEVIIPKMPDTEHPKIEPWVNKLIEEVGSPRKDDVFIGHSIGCQTILRYLETLSPNERVEKVILIAPWWYLVLDENESLVDAEPWLNTFVNFEKLKTKTNKTVCVFSDDDPYVPLHQNVDFFKEKLNPDIVIKKKMSHFNEGAGIMELNFLPDLVI